MKRATIDYIAGLTNKKISIHALVKRATNECHNHILAFVYFNPRPREEGDKSETSSEPSHENFNPRPREEGDLFYRAPRYISENFNPHPREEGDQIDFFSILSDLYISIHALVKRATYGLAISGFTLSISIHALVKRATNCITLCYNICNISIHALVKRATGGQKLWQKSKKFQSTPS